MREFRFIHPPPESYEVSARVSRLFPPHLDTRSGQTFRLHPLPLRPRHWVFGRTSSAHDRPQLIHGSLSLSSLRKYSVHFEVGPAPTTGRKDVRRLLSPAGPRQPRLPGPGPPRGPVSPRPRRLGQCLRPVPRVRPRRPPTRPELSPPGSPRTAEALGVMGMGQGEGPSTSRPQI